MILVNSHAIREALRAGRQGTLLVQTGKNTAKLQQLISEAQAAGIAVRRLSVNDLTAAAGERQRGVALQLADVPAGSGATAGPAAPGGKVGRSSRPAADFAGFLERFSQDDALVVFLDGITDPHNLGAILRSADVFAADAVVLPTRRSAAITAAVVETSAGAAHYVPVYQVTNLNRALQEAKQYNFWLFGADMGGQAASRLDLRGRTGLVLGREGEGLHEHTARLCDQITSIPMRGHVDSLNVSVAAGILMHEVRRQQGW